MILHYMKLPWRKDKKSNLQMFNCEMANSYFYTIYQVYYYYTGTSKNIYIYGEKVNFFLVIYFKKWNFIYIVIHYM